MQTEKINIYDIHPASYNPRIMPEDEYNKLKSSLDTFGLVDPIIIDLKHDNTIIGGHQRYEVLNDIDDEQVLTLIPLGDIGLIIKDENIKLHDINDQKALNLALNKISGEWDYQKLDDILVELSNDDYMIELTGFDTDDILINDMDIIDDDIENELNMGVSEWDKQKHEIEDEYHQTDNTTFRIYYKEGDVIKIGNHVLNIGDLSLKDYTLKFKDELIITTTIENKQQIQADNKELFERTRLREYENMIKRRELTQ